MNVRKALPQRREAETLTFDHEEGSAFIRYVGTLGRYADGSPAELFLNSVKRETATDVNARDAAIAASLALQFGCPIETLQHALTRKHDNSPAGPLGKFLDLIIQK